MGGPEWAGSLGLWDNGDIDHARLVERVRFYADRAEADGDVTSAMLEMLGSEAGRMILDMPMSRLIPNLINDAYKPKMHSMYSQFMTGVEADFALNVRKTPLTLATMRAEDPELWGEFVSAVGAMETVPPLPESTLKTLHTYLGLDPTPVMIERAAANGVAPVAFQDIHGEVMTFASGPVEAASNVETSMMQLVQQYTLRAQARALERSTGVKLDRTERLANSLAKLCRVVSRINEGLADGCSIALFAGRRSSDRTFLLLQNLFCMKKLKSFVGTSAVWAVEVLDSVFAATGGPPAGLPMRLVGTHAHEEVSLISQLAAEYDDQGGDAEQGPCQVSSLLAHLLFFARHGTKGATALADTFGTAAFLAAAEAATVPAEFREDIVARHGVEVPEDASVADLIEVWRLDSGEYSEVAEEIVKSCERRGKSPPVLMHSNLESWQHVVKVSQLPERIRPKFLGFGTLADGFVPFENPSGGDDLVIKMTSVVMKAVQGRVAGRDPPANCPCAGKRGDDKDAGKVQVDVRLSESAQEAARVRLDGMSKHLRVDASRVSAALAAAYRAVAREGSLQGAGGGSKK